MSGQWAEIMAIAGRQTIRPDMCVIGGGTAGLAAASAAAAFGVNVVLIERGAMGGGDLYGGSVPAQALFAAAARAKAARNGAELGAKGRVDFAAVRQQVRNAVAAAAMRDTPERLKGLGVRIVEGEGRFTGADTVAVDGNDIQARRFVIATGSSPAVPAIPGLATTPHLTPETLFDLAECPRHLIVLGDETTGLELAQAFRRLGAEVTVVAEAEPLAGEDAECAAIVRDALAREGVAFRTGVTVNAVRRTLSRVQVDIAGEGGPQTVEGSHLLITTGRRPNVEALDLDKAGVRYSPAGIAVDRGLRTSRGHIYAIGDVTAGPKLSHLAHHQAGLVVRQALFRMAPGADRQAVPRLVATDPELAQVGPLEDEARARAGTIRVLRAPYRENDRAQACGATAGHIKIVTDRRGAVLGATIVGPGARENIAAWTLAINQNLNIEALAGVMVPYPSYAEVGKRAARTYFSRGLTSPLVRRIIGWLRRFG